MSVPSLAGANLARRAANDQRARAIAAVATGRTTPAGILRASCLPDSKAYLRIPLVRLLAAQEGVSRRRARQTVATVLDVLDMPHPGDKAIDALTVMWVLDSRAAGRRIRALADVLDQDKHSAPWRGFPYAVQVAPTPAQGGTR